ncbi:MAG: hypothetical protein DWP92_02085 [Armatimonadetes bacterium]|nr:MAG: hypothetical protein DWP92_02085 [Armatimonadota bacterium]
MRWKLWQSKYEPGFQLFGSGLTNAQAQRGNAKDYGGASDELSVRYAKQNAGAAGQGALAELQRRHAAAMRRSSKVTALMAFAMIVLAGVQLVVVLNQ